MANVPGWAVNFLQLPRSIATAALEHFSRGSVRLLRSPRRKLTAPSVKTTSCVKPWLQSCYAVAAKLSRDCCKAVTYVGLLARQKPPTNRTKKRKPQEEACRHSARKCNLTERELVLARKAAKKPLLATSKGRKASTKGSSARLSTWFSTLKQQFPSNGFSALLFYNCHHPTTLSTQKGEPRGPPLLSCFGLAVGSRWLPMPTCASSERA